MVETADFYDTTDSVSYTHLDVYKRQISSQYVLCAVGRKPNAAGLFLDPEEFADIAENSAALTTKHLEAAAQTAHDLGITMERGFIETDIYGPVSYTHLPGNGSTDTIQTSKTKCLSASTGVA